MPSPIAHCKQSVVLLVVSMFLLGCVVPSSMGSAVEIRSPCEENNDLSKHGTAKKGGGGAGTIKPRRWHACHCYQFPELTHRSPNAAFDH